MRALLLLPCLLCLEGFHGPAGLGGFGEGIGDPVFLEEVGEDLLGAAEVVVLELDLVVGLAGVAVPVDGEQPAFVFDVDAVGGEGGEYLQGRDVDVEHREEPGGVALGEHPLLLEVVELLLGDDTVLLEQSLRQRGLQRQLVLAVLLPDAERDPFLVQDPRIRVYVVVGLGVAG